MEKQDMRVLTLDPYQHGVVINALNNLRNDLIEDKRPTDIVDEVLIKTVDAPSPETGWGPSTSGGRTCSRACPSSPAASRAA